MWAEEHLLPSFAIPRHDARFSGFAEKDDERSDGRRLPIEGMEITSGILSLLASVLVVKHAETT